MSHSHPDSNANHMARILPKKEADLFRSVVRHYETKQYKKGLKAAEMILKKFPKHGETLCMKGLLFNCTGKKEEAITMVKMGLMNDMRSHVCWHVYGLIHRSERNYNEAIKAYKQALRIDPANLQILRDLSLLQIQLRDLHGFAITRHTILNLKPNQMVHWLTFALSKHLTGDLNGAISVIDIYKSTLDKGSPELSRGYESSELALYQNQIVAEIPDNYHKALEHLDRSREIVVDEITFLTLRASYLVAMARFQEAQDIYLRLFTMGMTEDYTLHSGLMYAVLQMTDGAIYNLVFDAQGGGAMGTLATFVPLSSTQRQLLLHFYIHTLTPLYPKSITIRRIPLTLYEGQALHSALDHYVRQNLSKGIPSLGQDLASLFLVQQGDRLVRVTDPWDVRNHPTFGYLASLVDDYITYLERDFMFPPLLLRDMDQKETILLASTTETTTSSSSTTTEVPRPIAEPPSTLLWTYYVRAILHELAGEYDRAIQLADRCIEHTATAVDMYELKGRILKAAGDVNTAADVLDIGRQLDKQDRYINNLTTQYMLQANRESQALETISLFTRHESPPEKNIFDMQCTWYELELAACYSRKGFYGKSLKKYLAVEKHFDDFQEDQFDFHAYCIRKVTLRAYRSLLQWEDTIWGHDFYCTAAEGIIHIYLHLYDNPLKDVDDTEEPSYSSMTAAERKKAKAIARKKKKKDAVDVMEDKTTDGATKKEQGDLTSQGKATDPDPDGNELLMRNPLDEAKKYVSTLVKNAPKRLMTWIYQYDVAIRRGKVLMALHALFKASTIDKNSGELFSRMIDFMMNSTSLLKDSHPVVKGVLQSSLAVLLGSESVTVNDLVKAEVANLSSDPKTTLSKRISVARAMIRYNVGSRKDAATFLITCGINCRGVSVESCRESVRFLRDLGDEVKEELDQWLALVRCYFPRLDLNELQY